MGGDQRLRPAGRVREALRIVEERGRRSPRLIIAELGGTALKAGFEIAPRQGVPARGGHASRCAPEGRILPSPVDGKENRVYRVPVGVVGVISPFNFPFFLSMKSRRPGAGPRQRRRPQAAPGHPDRSAARWWPKIFEDAGLPAGLLNVVITEIAEIGDAFLEHPVPRGHLLHRLDTVGRHVGEVAARHFKRAVLELGGNSALVVCDDADLDYAVDAAVFSRFVHQGQVCMAANRVLVDSSVADEFTEKFVAKVGRSRPATRPTPRRSSAR